MSHQSWQLIMIFIFYFLEGVVWDLKINTLEIGFLMQTCLDIYVCYYYQYYSYSLIVLKNIVLSSQPSERSILTPIL